KVLRNDKVMPEDLSLEERDELSNIRRRKKELLDDIERLKFEISEVMTEIEHLTCVRETKSTQKNKQIAVGRKKFNMDPKKVLLLLLHLWSFMSLHFYQHGVMHKDAETLKTGLYLA
uniref:Uncharacterized protein n=1 Tax=Sinocyclocheilus grahami TaxID=75366 RepID=A0A672PB35_SINGR